MEETSPKRNKKSKTLVRTIGEAGILMTASNLVTKLASLVSAILVIRYLNVYEYGLWQLITSVIGIFAIFSLPGLEKFLISDLSLELVQNNEERYRVILKNFLKNILFVSCLAGILLYIFAPYVGTLTSRNLTLYIRILSFIFIFTALKRFYLIILYSKLEFFKISILKASDSLFYLVLILFFIFHKKMELFGITISYLGSSFFTCLFFFPLILKEIARLGIGEKREYKNILWQSIKTHGKWSLADDYLSDFLTNLRPWIIGFFLNAEALAIFSVAKNIYSHLATIVPLDQIVSPIIPRQLTEVNKFNLFFSRTIKYSIWFSIFLVIVAYFFVPHLVQIFFPQYMSSLPLFNILLASLLATPILNIITQTYYALKAQKFLFLSNFLKIISIIIFLPTLIILFNLKGVAFEFVMLTYLLLFVRYYLLKRNAAAVNLDIISFFQFDKLDRFLIKKILNNLNKFKIIKNYR